MSEDQGDMKFKEGTQIVTHKAAHVVERLLGEAVFGTVYRVHDDKDKTKLYAMKVERKKDDRKDSKLQTEIAILKLVQAELKDKSHFTAIIDRGKREDDGGYYFIVMQLVGKSLADLKAKRKEKVITLPCGLSASQQCLEACQGLHKCGYIHRDLRPANYACGTGDNKRVFGIARKIVNDNNELKTPREKARFKGTVKFASIACHKSIEMGWKDDCESWFYLLMDVIQPLGLPWRKNQSRDDVLQCKEDVRKDGNEQLFEKISCAKELELIMKYIDRLRYYETVDYSFIYDVLAAAAETAGGTHGDPYDWEKEKDDEE